MGHNWQGTGPLEISSSRPFRGDIKLVLPPEGAHDRRARDVLSLPVASRSARARPDAREIQIIQKHVNLLPYTILINEGGLKHCLKE